MVTYYVTNSVGAGHGVRELRVGTATVAARTVPGSLIPASLLSDLPDEDIAVEARLGQVRRGGDEAR